VKKSLFFRFKYTLKAKKTGIEKLIFTVQMAYDERHDFKIKRSLKELK
jgi:hypothetical protein